MSLDMLLQILRSFERFTTELAFVRLQGDMDSDMRGYVIAFDGRCPACTPLASEVEVICALATNMTLADVILHVQVD